MLEHPISIVTDCKQNISMNEENAQTSDSLLIATFLLGDGVFGIDAQLVQEVARVRDITPVHQAPPFVVGIRNLRGRIITVVDLRSWLELGSVATTLDNRILIVDSLGEPIGLLVDSVADTVTADLDTIAPPPPNLHGVQGRNLRGVCRGNGRLVALLDLQALFQPTEGGEPGRMKAEVS